MTPAGVRDVAEIQNAVAAFAREPNGAIVVLPAPVTVLHREAIIATVAQHRSPAVYPYRSFTVNRGLLSYGVDIPDLYKRAASYVDRILKGAKPAELPIQRPTMTNTPRDPANSPAPRAAAHGAVAPGAPYAQAIGPLNAIEPAALHVRAASRNSFVVTSLGVSLSVALVPCASMAELNDGSLSPQLAAFPSRRLRLPWRLR